MRRLWLGLFISVVLLVTACGGGSTPTVASVTQVLPTPTEKAGEPEGGLPEVDPLVLGGDVVTAGMYG